MFLRVFYCLSCFYILSKIGMPFSIIFFREDQFSRLFIIANLWFSFEVQ